VKMVATVLDQLMFYPLNIRSMAAEAFSRSSMGRYRFAEQWANASIIILFLPLSFAVPADAKPGRYAIPIDIRYGGRWLPQFSEAIVVVDRLFRPRK
jgi:hypothetical protein